MKATDIRARAFNLADLVNSSFPTWNDVSQSIFEAYRDIYAKYTEANSDFFLKQSVIPVIGSYLDPTSSSGLNEWLIPLPSDFLRGRFVEWMGQTVWQAMEKFPVRNKSILGSYPRYRYRNSYLWVIGSASMSFSQVRLGYYPSQPAATVPDVDYVFGAGITQLSNKALVTYPCYCDQEQSLLYVYNGTNVQIDSQSLGTNSVVLYTGATTISGLKYYAGYVYFLMGDALYRAPYLQTGPIVPVAILTTPPILGYTISTYDQKLYYSDGTNIYSASLDGSGAATVEAYTGFSVYNLAGAITFYVDGSNLLKTFAGATLATGIRRATTDGQTYIFYQDTSGGVYSATYDGTALANQTLLRSGVSFMGPYFGSAPIIPGAQATVVSGRLPVIDYALDILAISSAADYDFAFPDNEANELMSYRMAVDFKRKQGSADPTMIQALMARLTEIEQRFKSVIRRDDFEPERIGNVYSRGWW